VHPKPGMTHGTGRRPPTGHSIISLMRHRRRHLLALGAAADDDPALASELAQLERDIEAGVDAIDRRPEAERDALGRRLREQIDAHDR